MGGTYAKFPSGPKPTYEVNAAVKAGQLVCQDGSTGKLKVAGSSADDIVLGMAITDALPSGTSDSSTDSLGNPVTYVGGRSPYVALETGGVVRIKNGGGTALALGDRVAVAADGEVKAATSGLRVIGYVTKGGAAGATVEVKLELGEQHTALA